MAKVSESLFDRMIEDEIGKDHDPSKQSVAQGVVNYSSNSASRDEKDEYVLYRYRWV